jgi:hypothetical protein
VKVARLDKDNDWALGGGEGDYITNLDALKQNIQTRLRSFQNDWFLDTTQGIDWITLLGKRNAQDQIANEVRRVVLGTVGVLAITEFEIAIDRARRAAQINLTVSTIFDENIEAGVEVGA